MGQRDKIKGNTAGSTVLDLLDKALPDDKDNIGIQATKKDGLRAPAAVIDTLHSVRGLRHRGQRLLFERKEGETEDGISRISLDAAYIATQAGQHIVPDENPDEFAGTTGARKAIRGGVDLIRMLATAEKKLKHEEVPEAEAPAPIPEAAPEMPETPFIPPSRRDIEQYRIVQSRLAATYGEPPVRAYPRGMSKQEMREAIRSANAEIRSQGRHVGAVNNDVKRQKRTHQNTQRRNYRHKHRQRLNHAREAGQSAVPTASSPATPPATPKASATPTSPTIPASNAHTPAPVVPAVNATPAAAVPVPISSRETRNNRRRPDSQRESPRQRQREQRQNKAQENKAHAQPPIVAQGQGQSVTPPTQGEAAGVPLAIPISPLQHGTPPSLSTSTPQLKSKTGAESSKPKPTEKGGDSGKNGDGKADSRADDKADKKADGKTDGKPNPKKDGKKDGKKDKPENKKKKIDAQTDGKKSKLNHEGADNAGKPKLGDKQQSNSLTAQGGRYVRGKVADKLHSEVSKHEKDFGNTGIEASHKTVNFAGKVRRGHQKIRKLQHFVKTRHVRKMNHLKAKSIRHQGKAAQKALNSNPAYKGKPFAKAIQKARIKRQYAQAFRAAKAGKKVGTLTKGVAATAKTAKTAAVAVKIAAVKAKAIAAMKALLVVGAKFALIILLVILLLFLVVACVSMLGGGFTTIIESVSYQASADDLSEYSVYYTGLEVDLKEEILEAASDVDGLHEFRFALNSPNGDSLIIFEGIQITPGLGHPYYVPPVYAPPDFDPLVLLPFLSQITHNPFELMAYLTAVYGDFTDYDINAILREIFEAAFTLEIIEGNETRETMVEAWHYELQDLGDWFDFGWFDPVVGWIPNWQWVSDWQEVRIPPYEELLIYNWYYREVVLNVNMSVSDVLQERMNSEQQEHFDILMESLGLQQFVRSPFENNWLGAVTSVYGYRLHPITRTREMHTGIDIAMPEGTPIMGGLDGATVITAQDMGGYGLTVVIEFVDAETEQGVRVLYAHMASIAVNVGDVVNVGDILGAVGQTGTATGAHLHLEIFITEDGGATWRRVNPLFFTDPFAS